MSNPYPYRSLFAHRAKVWAFMLITIIPLFFVSGYMPRWLLIAVLFAYWLLILFPVAFGIGPLGRLIGRRLNEAAVAHAAAERKALGPSSEPVGTSTVPSGPGGEGSSKRVSKSASK